MVVFKSIQCFQSRFCNPVSVVMPIALSLTCFKLLTTANAWAAQQQLVKENAQVYVQVKGTGINSGLWTGTWEGPFDTDSIKWLSVRNHRAHTLG